MLFLRTNMVVLKKDLLFTWLSLHLVVLIYGFTAILGKLIAIPALELVWYRMMIAILTFFIYLKFRRE